MEATLKAFIDNSTPEQLRAELTKGHRPLLMTIDDLEAAENERKARIRTKRTHLGDSSL